MTCEVRIIKVNDCYMKELSLNTRLDFTISDMKKFLSKELQMEAHYQFFFLDGILIKDDRKTMNELSKDDNKVILQLMYDYNKEEEMFQTNFGAKKSNTLSTEIKKQEVDDIEDDSEEEEIIPFAIPIDEHIRKKREREERKKNRVPFTPPPVKFTPKFNPDMNVVSNFFNKSLFKVKISDYVPESQEVLVKKEYQNNNINAKNKEFSALFEEFLDQSKNSTQVKTDNNTIKVEFAVNKTNDEEDKFDNLWNIEDMITNLILEEKKKQGIDTEVNPLNDSIKMEENDYDYNYTSVKIEDKQPQSEPQLSLEELITKNNLTHNKPKDIAITNPEVANKVKDIFHLNSYSLREKIIHNFHILCDAKIWEQTNSYALLLEFYNDLYSVKIDNNFLLMNKKINLVLDLDNTLVYAHFHDKQTIEMIGLKHRDAINKKITIKDKVRFFSFKPRNGLYHFFKKVKDYTNFYINTLGVEEYACEITKYLEAKFGVKIPETNITSRIYNEEHKTLKNYCWDEDMKKRTIIIDDRSDVWTSDLNSYKFVINSMKYVNYFFHKGGNIEFNEEWQLKDLLVYQLNLSYTYDLNRCYVMKHRQIHFRDRDAAPLHLEYEKSNKRQLFYLAEAIEKIYKICSLIGCDSRKAINFIKTRIFLGCTFNISLYDFESTEARSIAEHLIISCGGKIKSEIGSTVTHFIVSQAKLSELDKIKKNSQYIVNVKFIFHSFYFLDKMNEMDKEYSDIYE